MTPNRQSSMIFYLVMLMGFVFGYLYNSQLDPYSAVPIIQANFQMASLRGLDTIKIDYKVLTSEQFRALRIFGQLPVQPNAGGSGSIF